MRKPAKLEGPRQVLKYAWGSPFVVLFSVALVWGYLRVTPGTWNFHPTKGLRLRRWVSLYLLGRQHLLETRQAESWRGFVWRLGTRAATPGRWLCRNGSVAAARKPCRERKPLGTVGMVGRGQPATPSRTPKRARRVQLLAVKHSAFCSPNPTPKMTGKKVKRLQSFYGRTGKEQAADKRFQQLLERQKTKLSERRDLRAGELHTRRHLQAPGTTEAGTRHGKESRAESLKELLEPWVRPPVPTCSPKVHTSQSHSLPEIGGLF